MPDSLDLSQDRSAGSFSARDARRELALQSAALALVTTIYMLGGTFAREKVPLGNALVQTMGVFAMHFVVSWGMLWTIRRGLGTGQVAVSRSAGRAAAVVLQSAAAGLLLLAVVFLIRNPGEGFQGNTVHFVAFWNLSLATLLVIAHLSIERSRAATGALHESQVRRLAQERELASAQLQLLQAQVEPHFIFNALATVRRLLRIDPAAARTLLADLLRYLEEALPRLRDERTTLGREAELVRAFLAVHQVRMGDRLRTEIVVPPELAGCEVPPMVLLTLVENALKHGLQPVVGGGTIRVAAASANGRLVLTVADTGRGMGSGSGHGTGLANVRARLKSMYGSAASLALEVNEPSGVVATVTLPMTAR
jgi:signal transduction histidine kinase